MSRRVGTRDPESAGRDPVGGSAETIDSAGLGALTAVHALERSAAIEALAPLFEGAPRFLGRLVAARPFGSWDELFTRARAIAHAMPEDEQVELIDAHPRLGAPPGSVSPMSYVEQGYDREAAPGAAGPRTAADPEHERLARELERLNLAYEARFGFRYCVFVAGRPRAALIPGLEAALAADRESELHRALDAVIDIAADRLAAPDRLAGPDRLAAPDR